MENFKYVIVAAIWLGLIVTAVTGYFYTPNFRMRRRESPRDFWIIWSISVLMAMGFSYAAWQLK